MGLIEHMVRTARNNAWSNPRLIKAMAAVSAAAWHGGRTSFFPSSLCATMNHIPIADWLYLDTLRHGGRMDDLAEPGIG